MNQLHRSARLCVVRLPILLSLLLGSALVIGESSAHAASAVTIGGPFTLSTPDGTTVTDRTYRGKWLLVYFGYTFCPNSCPTMLLDIAAALSELGPDAAKVQPLFITIDPQRDTPQVMQQYTQSFDQRILGLTGTSEQIAAAAQAYGAYYVRYNTGPGVNDYVMDHSTYLYIMDPEGKFVRAFHDDTSSQSIANVLRRLLESKSRDGSAG